jgi:Ran GTPase-activating protein (RanGAP) involved in mRNA processing and transport
LQARGAAVLGQALAGNSGLEVLRLSECLLENAGAIALAKGLHSNVKLRDLHLAHDRITATGAEAIADCMAGCDFGEGVGKCPLRRLDLSHNLVADAGVLAMAQALESATTLRELVLQDCDIGAAGARISPQSWWRWWRIAYCVHVAHICNSSRACSYALHGRLLRVRLPNMPDMLVFAGAACLGECLEVMALEMLDLTRNHVRNEGASELGLSLQRNVGMRELHLPANGIKENGAIALAVALKSNETMHYVDLRGNSFPCVRLKLASMLGACKREVQLLHD